MSEAQTPGSDEPGGAPAPGAPAPGAPAPGAPASWQPATAPNAVPGATGFVFADVPNRIVALIIDAIVLALISVVLGIVLGIVGLQAGLMSGRFDAAVVIYGILGFAISVGYFMYSWTRMRATVGMRVLGMQVGNAFDGKTITSDQAIRRAIALWGPSMLAQFFNGLPAIGSLLGLVALGWVIYLLYTTSQSPTKQGFHDTFANTVVVKATRVV